MKTLLRLLTALVLISGISLTVSNGVTYAQAQLTGVGTDVLMHPAASEKLQQAIFSTPLVPIYESANAADEMVIGILLILLGFFIHALLVSHDERSVRITAVPREERPRKRSWFWIEMSL